MKSTLTILASFILLSFTAKKINEYLSVEGPLEFNDTKFSLKWSDKPNKNYYIQEYIPKGENTDSFNQMLTIHLFDLDIELQDAVKSKIKELIKRKETDAVCNYQITESPDGKEIMVDFLLSESRDGKTQIIEFNIYHYRKIQLDKNKNGIAVYAYSKRSYGNQVTEFLKNLKTSRNNLLNEMISTEKPKILLKNK